MRHLVGQRPLARVEHAPASDTPTIAGLAAAERIEHRAVELYRITVHGSDGRLAGLEIGVVAKKQLGHQCSSTTSATPKITRALAAKNISVVCETSGRSRSRGIG